KEMLAAAQAAQGMGRTGTNADAPVHHIEPPAPPKDRTGTLTVMEGKTDESFYVLGKMSVIGKSDMASIKLKGFFAPKMAALINKRDTKYFIAASEAKIKVTINGQPIAGQKELNEGDIVEVAGIKATFGYKE